MIGDRSETAGPINETRCAMTASICLNMIVKNEAGVIRRCLDSVMPFIDRWVIVDTGSTDGTQDIIASHLRGLPGQLHSAKWKDFGSNRTEAIKFAAGQGDYLLFMDADDIIVTPPGFRMPELTAGAYQLMIEYGGLNYWRTAMVSQSLSWRYAGVLHEYLECDVPYTTARLDGPKIVANVDEGEFTEESRTEKYRTHVAILKAALAKEPDNTRNTFYLAQSYRDSKQPQLALKTYEKRAAMGGWEEEVWYSKFQAAVLSERLSMGFDHVVSRYLDAHEFRPGRAEALTSVARYCRENSKFHLAELFAERAARIAPTTDILFVDKSAYQWRALDELSVAKYWTGDYQNSAAICRQLLASPDLPENQNSRIAANLKFSEDKLTATPSARPVTSFEARPAHDSTPLESILDFTGTVQVADIGAAFIAEVPPYKPLIDRGIGFLNAFDADQRQHEKIREAFGGRVKVFSNIVGDGRDAQLRLASPASGMSSLLEPHAENLAFFNGFSSFGKIYSTETVNTSRLDDIAGLPKLDFLKMDIQGSEMAVLMNGAAKLSGCVAIQLEISFVPLYRGQPCFGEVDVWMSEQNFIPHAMTDLKRWSISPLIRDNNFRVPFNQLLEGDIVYFRDPISAQSLSVEQIKKLALVAHYSYASPDMAVHLLKILVNHKAIEADAVQRYLELLEAPSNPPLGLFF